ncbi:hypothetical protein [Herbaspirillum huttiense]|uniref:Uncharacterized protein n=2 Tax=Herbaspirillum huttiense TaxID=863372 RepID=A0AAJ2HEY2_9BURK|nr:hypothetical protein [Herbaspirillum huttiense]MDR9839421.1 hypothetical protein [Herbaspirillum huttiense]
MQGLTRAQRHYDRMEPLSRDPVDLSSAQIEKHIKLFAESDEPAKDYLVDRGVSAESVGDCADLLRELAVQCVRGNDTNSYFWNLMSNWAHTMEEADRAANPLSHLFGDNRQFLDELGIGAF